VNAPHPLAKRDDADHKQRQRYEHPARRHRTALDQRVGPRAGVAVPVPHDVVDEEEQQAVEIEDPLRQHRAEGVGEADLRSSREERGPRHVTGANRKNGREHVADRVGEKRRVERGRLIDVEQLPPADGAEDQRHEVDEESGQEPGNARSADDPPDIAQIALHLPHRLAQNAQFVGSNAAGVLTRQVALRYREHNVNALLQRPD